MRPIYLDHNATSPLLPEVREAMEPWLGVPANPASAHGFGQRAAVAVERAREQVAALVGRPAAGIVFTSGATEANHAALRGLAPGRVAVAAIEHPCVLAAVRWLEERGAERVPLPVDSSGVVDLPPSRPVDLVVLMAANHETGVVQPLQEALDGAREGRWALHVDAVQAAGRMPLALQGATTVALSAHKLGGPAGVGALSLPDGDPFPPLLTGGAQERGRRAGTVNTAGVVGFGLACALARTELEERVTRFRAQRDRIETEVRSLGGRVVGSSAERVPNTICAVFPGLEGELLVQALDLRGVAVSHGAACASGSLDPSPVLTAMGDPEPRGAVRISLGPRTEDQEVERAVAVIREVVGALGP